VDDGQLLASDERDDGLSSRRIFIISQTLAATPRDVLGSRPDASGGYKNA